MQKFIGLEYKNIYSKTYSTFLCFFTLNYNDEIEFY